MTALAETTLHLRHLTRHLASVTPGGYADGVMTHPALRLIEETKDRAAEAREALARAEREHHEAIMSAVNMPDPDHPDVTLFSVAEVASAAGVSRSRIYKRLGRPEYGNRKSALAS